MGFFFLSFCPENLLEECARPRQKEGRWKVKDKLLNALEALKDGRKEHLNVLQGTEDKDKELTGKKEKSGDDERM